MLAAANKIDALDDPERLARLQDHLQRARHSALRCVGRDRARGSTPLLEAIWREVVAAARKRAAAIADSTASRNEPGRPHRHSRRHARSDSLSGTSTRPLAAREALGARSGAACCRRASRRTARRSRSPRRFIASRWRRSRSTASTGLEASDVELARAGPVLHGRHAERLSRARAAARRRFSSSPAPTRLQKLKRGTAIPRCSTSRTSSSSRARATPVVAARAVCRRSPAACDDWSARAGGYGQRDTADFPAGCAPRRTCRRPRSARGCEPANRSPGSFPTRRAPHPSAPSLHGHGPQL